MVYISGGSELNKFRSTARYPHQFTSSDEKFYAQRCRTVNCIDWCYDLHSDTPQVRRYSQNAPVPTDLHSSHP